MNVFEAARRLGVAEHAVLTVREHPAGHLAELRGGRTMLVTPTVARVYVPDVDDPAEEPSVAEPAAPAEEPPAKEEAKPAEPEAVKLVEAKPAEKSEDKPKRAGRPRRNY